MILNLPNRNCCDTDDVRHLCNNCARDYNAAHRADDPLVDNDDDVLPVPNVMELLVNERRAELDKLSGERGSLLPSDDYGEPPASVALRMLG